MAKKPERYKLTATNVADLLPPESGQVFYWDIVMPGFGLRISAGGKKVYIYQARVNGKERRISLGSHGQITAEQARKLAKKNAGLIAQGVDPVKEAQEARRKSVTVAELFKLWTDERMIGADKANPLKKSWRKDQRLYDCHLKIYAKRQVSEVTQELAKRIFRNVTVESGPVEANHVQRLARAIWNHAAKQEPPLVESNPWATFKANPETPREVWIQHDQLPMLLAAFDGLQNQDHADLFRLCLFTGARSGNVKSMRWAELHLKQGTWNIPGSKHKNSKPVMLGLSQQALEVLERRKGCNNDWVFPNPATKSGHVENTIDSWEAVKASYAKALDLPEVDLHIHDLRHTLASWLVSAGTSLAMVGRALGHASLQSTARYAHLAPASVHDAVASVTAAMTAKPGEAKEVVQ